MTKDSRRRPRMQTASSVKPKQLTMDDIIYCPSSTFLVQEFSLNSYHRIVARKGQSRRPASPIVSSDILQKLSGRKCNTLDLEVLLQSFANYRKAVNLILERVFSDIPYADILGEELEQSRGMAYLVLR
ncbi:MAG: hypothetical protein ACFFER_04435, partial [Candidatus Thorarchaeota archaeon]